MPKSVICLEIVRWTRVGAPDPDPLFSVSSLARTETVVFGESKSSEISSSCDESFRRNRFSLTSDFLQPRNLARFRVAIIMATMIAAKKMKPPTKKWIEERNTKVSGFSGGSSLVMFWLLGSLQRVWWQHLVFVELQRP